MLLFVLLAKAVGAAKEARLASLFALGEVSDRYASISGPAFAASGMLLSVLSAVLVPRRAVTELPRYAGEVRTVVMGVALAIASAAFVMVGASVAKRDSSVVLPEVSLYVALAAMLSAGLVASLASALAMGERRYDNTLAEALAPAAILVWSFVAPAPSFDGLVVATVAGLLAQAGVIGLSFARGELGRELFRWSWRPTWSLPWSSFGWAALWQVSGVVAALVDSVIATNLASGTMASISFANRIVGIALSVAATSIARTLLPFVSSLPRSEGHAFVRRIAPKVLVASTLISGTVAAAARVLVVMLFEHGAFSSANTDAVALAVRLLLLQVPPSVLLLVVTTQLCAQQAYRRLALVGVVGASVKCVVAYLLARSWGVTGLLFATAISTAVACVLAWSLMDIQLSDEMAEGR